MSMKPDGTYTVEELAEICDSQLQSWEREQLSERITDVGYIRDTIRNMTIDELEDITGYYIYDEEQESDIDDFSTEELMDELEERLCYCRISVGYRDNLINALKDAKVYDIKKIRL